MSQPPTTALTQEAFRLLAANPRRSQVGAFAIWCHGGQRRTDGPYVLHPLRVGASVAKYARPLEEAWVLAAYLHDVLEDCGTSYDDLVAFFERIDEPALAKPVAGLVVEVTQDKRLPRSIRQRASVEGAGRLSLGARHIKLADVYDNLLALEGLDPGKRERVLHKGQGYLAALAGTCKSIEDLIAARLASLRAGSP